MKLSRLTSAIAGVSFVVIGLAEPALAEGSFSSHISSGARGFESRSWQDNNLDNTNGYVNFKNCNSDGPSYGTEVEVDVGIYKEDAGPDTQVGREVLQCQQGGEQSSDSVYEGDVPKDQYHFTIKGVVNGYNGKVNVSSVKVAY